MKKYWAFPGKKTRVIVPQIQGGHFGKKKIRTGAGRFPVKIVERSSYK
jgi:hypothetical protein